jgi:hypothetical protein
LVLRASEHTHVNYTGAGRGDDDEEETVVTKKKTSSKKKGGKTNHMF